MPAHPGEKPELAHHRKILCAALVDAWLSDRDVQQDDDEDAERLKLRRGAEQARSLSRREYLAENEAGLSSVPPIDPVIAKGAHLPGRRRSQRCHRHGAGPPFPR